MLSRASFFLVSVTKTRWNLVTLAAEGAALGEPGLSTGGLAEYRLAARAHHYSLGVAEHSGSENMLAELELSTKPWYDQRAIKTDSHFQSIYLNPSSLQSIYAYIPMDRNTGPKKLQQ